MSKIDSLNGEIKEGNSKLRHHQKEVSYWLTKLQSLNKELAEEIRYQQRKAEEEQRKSSNGH